MTDEKFRDDSGSKLRNLVTLHSGSISVGTDSDADKTTRYNNALGIVVDSPSQIRIEAKDVMLEALAEMDVSLPNILTIGNGAAVITNRTPGKNVSVSSLLDDMTKQNAVGDGLDKKPFITKDQATWIGDKIARSLRPATVAVTEKPIGPPKK